MLRTKEKRQAKVEEYKEALAMIEEDVTEDWSDPTKAAAHTAAPATVNGKSDEGGPGGGLAGKENGDGGGGGELAYSASVSLVGSCRGSPRISSLIASRLITASASAVPSGSVSRTRLSFPVLGSLARVSILNRPSSSW